jgi:hypothetical protein
MIQRYAVPLEEHWHVIRAWTIYVEAHSRADAVTIIAGQLRGDIAPADLQEIARVTDPKDEWTPSSGPSILEYSITTGPTGGLHDYPTLITACRLLADDNVPPQIRQDAYEALIKTPLVEGLDYAAAEAELHALSEKQLEECIQDEEGSVPVTPATEAVLQYLFDNL